MNSVKVPIGQPYGDIVVNTDRIYAAVVSEVAGGRIADLLIDCSGTRLISTQLSIAEVGVLLGSDFAQAVKADSAHSTCHPDRCSWVSIVPVTGVADVVHVNYGGHFVPLRGSVESVRQLLVQDAAEASA